MPLRCEGVSPLREREVRPPSAEGDPVTYPAKEWDCVAAPSLSHVRVGEDPFPHTELCESLGDPSAEGGLSPRSDACEGLGYPSAGRGPVAHTPSRTGAV